MSDPEVADECIRLVEVAAEVDRLVDLLELHVAKAGRFGYLPDPVAICEGKGSWRISRWLRELAAGC